MESTDVRADPERQNANTRKTNIVAGIVVVATIAVAIAVVLVVILSATPSVVGTYAGHYGGVQITLAKDGSFAETPSHAGLSQPDHYWVSGNNISIGVSTSGPKGWPTVFKIEGNNRLVGLGSVWVKVKPNWPSALLGTYLSKDGELLALGDEGAVVYSQQKSFDSPGWRGTWVAGKSTVTITHPDSEMKHALTVTYKINGKSLTGGATEFVKKWDAGVTPDIK